MKKIKNLFKLLMMVIPLVLVLGACGNGGESSDTETSEPATEETEEATEEEATEETEAEADSDTEISEVVVATSGTSDLFSQIDPDAEEWTGIDGDVWREIEDRTGWTVEIKQVAFDGLIGELDTGRADVASNHMELTEERQSQALPSTPYSSEAAVFQILEENSAELQSEEDFEVVGVKSGGSTTQRVQDELAEEYGFEVRTYQENAELFNDLVQGRVDAVVFAESSMQDYSEKIDAQMVRAGEPIAISNVAMLLQDNEEGQVLKEELDAVIQEMVDDGTIAEITKKWTGLDLTQNISAVE